MTSGGQFPLTKVAILLFFSVGIGPIELRVSEGMTETEEDGRGFTRKNGIRKTHQGNCKGVPRVVRVVTWVRTGVGLGR